MSADKPTTPEDGTTVVSPEEHWLELQARVGGEPEVEDEPSTSQGEAKGAKETGKRSPLHRARPLLPAVSIAFAVALAWVIVPALVGGGSARRYRSTPVNAHAKLRKAEGRRPSRARWVKDPAESPGAPHKRTAPARHARRHALPRREPRRPAPPPAQPAPEASVPAPPPASEQKSSSGPRDGATESTEFGF